MAKGNKTEKTVEIAGVALAVVGKNSDDVPAVEQSYHFGDLAADIANDILENKKVMLTGHAGTGKTSLIMQIAARIGQPVFRANLNGQMTPADLFGQYIYKGGETVWVDGVLPKAMREGAWLVLDEIDFCDPEILGALNDVAEKDGKLTLKEHGFEIVRPHENFRLFATANTAGALSGYRHLYQGTVPLNFAFLDRFRIYVVSHLSAKDETKVVVDRYEVPEPVHVLVEKMIQVANQIREAFVKEEIQFVFSMRRVFDWYELVARYADSSKDPLSQVMRAAEGAIFARTTPQDAEVIKQLITRNFGRG